MVEAFRPLRPTSALAELTTVEVKALAPQLGSTESHRDEGPSRAPGRLYKATLGLLSALTGQRPVALLLDNLHRVDRATLDLLLFLTANLTIEPALTVVTVR